MRITAGTKRQGRRGRKPRRRTKRGREESKKERREGRERKEEQMDIMISRAVRVYMHDSLLGVDDLFPFRHPYGAAWVCREGHALNKLGCHRAYLLG